MNFEIHHFAYLTNDMERSVKEMNTIGFELEGATYIISSQKVSVCFLKNSKNIRFELVKPFDDNVSLNKLISSGVTLYHTGYLVPSIEECTEYLLENGYYKINMFHSEAFNGNKCAFFVSRSKNLIELIEQ